MNYINPQHDPRRGDPRAVVTRAPGNEVEESNNYPGQPYPYYPQYAVDPEPAKQFDVWKYVRILLKYRRMIAVVTTSCMVLAAMATFLMTPIYRATVSIQIDRETLDVVDLKSVQPDQTGTSTEFYQTQYELLASRALAERVVNTLGIIDDPAFHVKSKSLIGNVRDILIGAAKPEAETMTVEQRVDRDVNALIRDSITVTPVRGSRIVKVNVDHAIASEAQKIANGYADAFITDNLDRRYDATSYARKFLEERLQQLKVKLQDSEKQMVLYAEQQGIINLDDNKNIAFSDLENINTKLAEAHSARVKSELLWKQAQSTAGFGLKEILNSQAIQDNRKRHAELTAEYQQKLAMFKPAFPVMVQLRNQIKELDNEAQHEIQAIKESIRSSFLTAKQEEESLRVQLGSTKTDVVDQRNRSIQYNILKREVDTNRTLYEGLLQRYKEIGVSGAVGSNNISVVDKAILPSFPRSPNIQLNIVFGLIGGLILGLMLALGLDYLDDSFKSPEELEREIGLPVIGVIPKPAKGVTVDTELLDARSGMSEAMRSLRTGLQFSTSDGLPKTLLITSSKPSEGKTTTSIALAKSLASIGLNVLLIDGDLRNASVHRRLQCSNELGLSNYLTGSKLPEEVVQSTDTEGLVVMASGPLPPNPGELLSGPRMLSLLSLGMESFDIVVVDGPPVMGLADAPLLSSIARATLLVVAAGETRRSTVQVALKRTNFARGNVIGVLLSKFDSQQAGYGYGYGEYDYHSYGVPKLSAKRA
jgi:polysaccharide biosynthesis transport protein